MSTDEERAAIVECAECGTPGIVKFKDEMTEIIIPCTCSRPSVEEANAMARAKEGEPDA